MSGKGTQDSAEKKTVREGSAKPDGPAECLSKRVSHPTVLRVCSRAESPVRPAHFPRRPLLAFGRAITSDQGEDCAGRNEGCEEVAAVSISSDEDDNASTCSDGDLFDSGKDEIDDFEDADRKIGLDKRFPKRLSCMAHMLQQALAGGLKASGCRAQVDAPIRVVPRFRETQLAAERLHASMEAFVLLPLGDGTGQPTKTRLPDEAIKAAVNIGKSKEERKGDAILKKLDSKEGATVSWLTCHGEILCTSCCQNREGKDEESDRKGR
ncbi:hypothetical protein Tcan_15561 [Toxocara canis]|uniref:Uncharacterized protein n=1 Tax=Toxocara canis TaxID=6265 RepID=A0A0B2VRB5_TOXCA|nr:hypothetical protein Tcan_15561 [Toxocara canis]